MRLGPRRISIAVLAAWGTIAGTSDTSAREPLDARGPRLVLRATFGDPIGTLAAARLPLAVRLTNVGDGDALVNARMLVAADAADGEVTLVAVGPDKKRLAMTWQAKGGGPSDDFRVLRPRESAWAFLDLADAFDCDAPGTYAVQAVYRNRTDPQGGGTAWKGEVASAVARFRRK